MLYISVLLFVFLVNGFSDCNASVVISRPDDDICRLDPQLIDEIAGYRNVTKHIMDDIKQNSGKDMYRQFTKFITTFGARPAGGQQLENAIDHMVALSKQYGITDVTTEPVTFSHWIRGEEYAELLSPLKKKIAILGLGTSVATPENGITAEAIVFRSFDELNNCDRVKVEGKIVVFNQPFVSYGDTVVYRSRGASEASKKGAVATLVRSITPFSLYTVHTGHQDYEGNVTKIPSACITHEDADFLHRIQNAGDKIKIHLYMNNSVDQKTSRNTILDFKGRESPEKHVLVSGHIDSWDVGEGAIDDGGGMMISWFVPVALKMLNLRPRRTMRTVLWTAEELGLIGANSYLENHKDQLNNLIFIMESDDGTFSPQGLDVGGNFQAQCIIAEVLKLFSPIDKMTVTGRPGSDITLIVAKGVPGASLLNDNERYLWFHHTEADTLIVQTEEDLISCAAFWAAFSYVIADLSVDMPR